MPRATPKEAKRLVKLLEKYHKESEKTWNEVSEDCGISFGTIVKWRRGTSRPTGQNYATITAWAEKTYPSEKKGKGKAVQVQAGQEPPPMRVKVDRGASVTYVVTLVPATGSTGTVLSRDGLLEALSKANLRATVLTMEEFRELGMLAEFQTPESILGRKVRDLVRSELDHALSNGVRLHLGE